MSGDALRRRLQAKAGLRHEDPRAQKTVSLKLGVSVSLWLIAFLILVSPAPLQAGKKKADTSDAGNLSSRIPTPAKSCWKTS